MCVYGHFNTRASNGTELLFQQCSSRMSDSSVCFADMYGRAVFCGQDSASHRPDFGACSHRVYSWFWTQVLRVTPYFRFCAKVNNNTTIRTNYSSVHSFSLLCFLTVSFFCCFYLPFWALGLSHLKLTFEVRVFLMVGRTSWSKVCRVKGPGPGQKFMSQM
jgi:hypothetical protein